MKKDNFYETNQLLSEYLLFHYGDLNDTLPYDFGPKDSIQFPQRCISEFLDTTILPKNAKALDVGCAVGSSTFELARYCENVIGIDYSKSFIDAANALKKDGKLDYAKKICGRIYENSTACIPTEIDRLRVKFEVGDAHALRDDIGSFNVVMAGNLLCRLHDPRKFLKQLSDLIAIDGQLILTTPMTWLEEFTPAENWLGGLPTSENTLDAIKSELNDNFELISYKNIPFLIREHARKFQWSIAQGSHWRRL